MLPNGKLPVVLGKELKRDPTELVTGALNKYEPPPALEDAAPSVEEIAKELVRVCAEEEDVAVEVVAVLKEKEDDPKLNAEEVVAGGTPPELGAGDSGLGRRVKAFALAAKAELELKPKLVGELAILTLTLGENPLKGLPDMIPDA